MTAFKRIPRIPRIPRLQISKRRLVKYLLLFFAVKFAAIGFNWAMVTFMNIELALMSPEERLGGVETYLVFAVLPFYIMLEEALFRVWPFWVLKNLEAKKLLVSFLFISTIYPSIIHQFNVISGSPLARLEYFAVMIPAELCLSWIYFKGRFWASWTAHYAWNLFYSVLFYFTTL